MYTCKIKILSLQKRFYMASTCEECGKSFPQWKGKRFCNATCRSIAHKKRRGEEQALQKLADDMSCTIDDIKELAALCKRIDGVKHGQCTIQELICMLTTGCSPRPSLSGQKGRKLTGIHFKTFGINEEDKKRFNPEVENLRKRLKRS